MRLLQDNYVTPVMIDASLYANVFHSFNQKCCLLQTFDVAEQNVPHFDQSQRITAKKPGSALTHLVTIDFQMKCFAAQLLKKNQAPVYENKRKSTKYLRNKFNYNL